jgi:hypothetical protein
MLYFNVAILLLCLDFLIKNTMYRSKSAGYVVLMFAGCIKIAVAADWKLEGTLGQALQYNDNIALNAQKEPVFGYVLTPGLRVQSNGQVFDLSLKGEGDIRIYDDSRWNCENYKITLANRYRSNGGRSIFELNGDYSRTCTLVQQLTDTGLLLPRTQSESYHIAPSWTWRWTPVDRVDINTSYSRQSYTAPKIFPGGVSPLSNNDTFNITIGETHDWSKRLLSKGSVFFTNTDFSGAQNSNQNYFGFQFGVNYLISRRWSVNVEGGPQWINSNAHWPGTSSERADSMMLGGMGRIDLIYKGQSHDFLFNISSSASPSSLGRLQQYTSVGIKYNHRITKRLMLDLKGNFLHSQSLAKQGLGFDRNYFVASIGLLWEPVKHWQLKGEYNYQQQEYKQENIIEAESNNVTLSLNYYF